MGIDKDLNIAPYFDDFDETKQFNKILFKPASAVQARELTQLQTILQNQVERFGSNVFKEGAIISGLNLTDIGNSLFYVKVNDQPNFTDPTIYDKTEDATYYLVGLTSGLRAEIVLASNGFQTRDPDLKTFHVYYLNSTTSNTGEEIRQFLSGETLSVRDEEDSEIISVTAAQVANHVGRSFAVSAEEGIIYQKGHFIYVEPQTIIVSKYTNIPDGVSVGFDIQENIITANEDLSLLDNAQGFNNENAPGADRLQLKPILTTYNSDSEPTEFFALRRYKKGASEGLRDVSQFNSIAEEMARRTFEESGNYVVRGMEVSVEGYYTIDEETGDRVYGAYAAVAPGKAYVFGKELESTSSIYKDIPNPTDTITKQNKVTDLNYGSYFTYDHVSGNPLNSFRMDGTRYNLYDAQSNVIGSCSVRNVMTGKIYVYALEKASGEEETAIAGIGNLAIVVPITGFIERNNSCAIFNTGNASTKSFSNISYTKRTRFVVPSPTTQITLSPTSDRTPLAKDVVAVDGSLGVVAVTNVTQDVNGNVIISLEDNTAEIIYYSEIVSNVVQDSLEALDVYVNTIANVTTNIADLGLPNAVELLEVIDDGGAGDDVTSKFKLVTNQKDGYYDHSYIKLKAGETQITTALQVKVRVLRRLSTVGSGFLTKNSYDNVGQAYYSIRNYTDKRGNVYDLFNSIDFRPYATPSVPYALSPAGAGTVNPLLETAINLGVAPDDDGIFISDQEFYLPRIDAVVLTDQGRLNVVKGAPSETPVAPSPANSYVLAEIYISGFDGQIRMTGSNAIRIKDKSNRTYTMKDIERIDNEVKRLLNVVSLSYLEQNTKDFFIPDGNGNNRFKNGILVDNFKSLDVSDIQDPDYKASIDKSYSIAAPAITQFPVDLVVQNGSNVSTGFTDIVTLADTGNPVEMLNQPFATNTRNVTALFYNYRGKMIISPEFDSSYDTVRNPAANIRIDTAQAVTDLVDNLQEVIPLTRTDRSVVSNTSQRNVAGGTRVTTSTTTTTNIASLQLGEADEERAVVGNYVTDIDFKPYVASREIRILVTGLRPNTTHHIFFSQDPVGNVTIPGQYVYTDLGNGTSELDVTSVEAAGNFGDPLVSDDNGILAAIFLIPENTYFVGENDIEIADTSVYTDIPSAAISTARATYRAYRFGISRQELSTTVRTPNISVQRSTVTTNNVTNRFIPNPPPPPRPVQVPPPPPPPPPLVPRTPPPPPPPPARREEFSCFVAGTKVTMADGSKKNIEEVLIGESLLGQDGSVNVVLEYDHPMLNGRDLIAFNGGKPFMTPEHPLWTKEGWKSFSAEMTQWQKPEIAHLMVNGDFKVGDEILMDNGTWFKIESIEVHSGEPEQRVYNFYLGGNNTYFADGYLAHNRGGGGSCFIAGTLVLMADGSSKKIEDVEIGELVQGVDSVNKVLAFDHPMLDGRKLIGINGSGPFKTPEHPLLTSEGWKAYDSEITKVQKPQIAHLMINGSLKIGDEILMSDGSWLTIESIEVFVDEPQQQVYNFVLDGDNTYFANGMAAHNRDPLSQTFFVKKAMADGATTAYVNSLSVYFKTKSNNNGITVELREVLNGYPAAAILPFGSAYLTPSQILTSDNGTVATTVTFKNPVKISTEKEYCFVLLPDRNDPNYTVFTSKVGGSDIVSGTAVTQDWGDGVLFASTNNRAWKSFPDEDVKFSIRRYEFNTNVGTVDFVPNSQEFLRLTNASVQTSFRNDELAFVRKNSVNYSASANNRAITIGLSSVTLNLGDYILVQSTGNAQPKNVLTKITNIVSNSTETVLTVTTPYNTTGVNENVSVVLTVAGRVNYYNPRKRDKIYLRESSARSGNFFVAGETLTGYRTSAEATISSIGDEVVTYAQPMIYSSDSAETSTEFSIYDENNDTYIPLANNKNNYFIDTKKTLKSKSNIVDSSQDVEEDFIIRATLNNNEYPSATPVIDETTAIANIYQYQITDDVETTSGYVSKEVILEEDMGAVGMKVLLSAYRPAGTMIDVYARFGYQNNLEFFSPWIKLANSSPQLYSNLSNTSDYREFQYDLENEDAEYVSFQIRIVLRHATTDELSEQQLTITPDINLFPHVYDYRAIALT